MSSKTEKVIFRLYIFAAIITAAVFAVSLIASSWGKGRTPAGIQGEWFSDSEMTVPADPEAPVKVTVGKDYYSRVPEDTQNGWCLSFKLKNCSVMYLYLDGEKMDSLEYLEGFYGNSMGTSWVYMPLSEYDGGKTVKISLLPAYFDKSCYIKNVLFGREKDIIIETISGRAVGLLTCVLLIFTGFVMIVVHAALKGFVSSEYSGGLLYLGCFSIATATWSLCETQMIQIFGVNSGAVHSLSCMSMMLIIMPLFMFFSEDVKGKGSHFILGVSALSALNFVVNAILHYTGIADFHQTLTLTHIVIGVSAVCVIYANYLKIFRNKSRTVYDILAGIGMVLFALSALLDVIRYRSGVTEDSSMFTRIGLLVYVFILGVCTLSHTIIMVKKGMTTDLISRLAYEDGLTGLGNRTAYIERLDKIAGKPAVIFVFDINNLKHVNDNLGHQSGDALIRAGADLILSVFGKAGSCYRTGGDEFVCLAESGSDAAALTAEFYGKQEEFNKSKKLSFPLVVAMGCEEYSGESDIKEAVDSADRNMYAKKHELKKGTSQA